ncbi:hypothetical protein Neosp_009751 [[Neocosmospora] mangrovei]
MGTDLYDASIPVFKNGMTSLKNILNKAIDHYGPNSPEILNATLIEDLRPLIGHVHLSSNIAKKSLSRMASIPTDVWDDDEDTPEKLVERCERTIKLLDGVSPDQMNGHEEDRVEMKLGSYNLAMSSREYLFNYAIPFFFFHLQLVYSILRMKGVPLGFADFLMPYSGPFLV